MKKVLLASISLLIFAAALLLVQVSCSKSTAQNNSVSQINKVLYVKHFGSSGDPEFWILDYDGNNLTRIIPNVPSNVTVYANSVNNNAALSPDGAKMFFRGEDSNLGIGLYRCDINGSNVVRLTSLNSNDLISGAY